MATFQTTKRAAEQHDAFYKKAADLLQIAGKTVATSKTPECHHPGGVECKDADEYLRRHGPVLLRELVGSTTPAGLSLDGEARKLAQIDDPLERDAQTKARATELKVRVTLLRDRVAHYRDLARAGVSPDDDSAPGKRLTFDKLGMAAEPVAGNELLDDLAEAIRRHAFIDEHDVVKAVLWTIHGHRRFHGSVQVLPRLVITAGREDSGKTTLAVALAHAADVALVTVSPRAANLYRSIEAHQVALFLDEADVWYPRNEDLREIVNSGFNRDGATVMRTEDVGAGGKRELEVRLYSTFTPMAIVGINLEKVLARTLLSRALIIRMTPARVGEVTTDIFANPPAVRVLRDIASRAKRWVADHEGALAHARPDLPGVINRLRLVWEPLIAIADAAGGAWPEKARAALEAERGRIRDPNLGEALLLDVLDVIAQSGMTGMHTKDIIEKLLPIELRPWTAYGRKQIAIRDIDVAELLAPYGLKPRQLKIRGLNRRGYQFEDIQAAIDRYVSSIPSSEVPEECCPATTPEDASDFNDVDGSGPGTTGGATSPDPLPDEPPDGNSEIEVAATQKLSSTDFPEENQSGSGVAPSGPPSAQVYAGEDTTAAIVLVCSVCGAAFEHNLNAKGRCPSKCPACRTGSSRGRPQHQEQVEVTPDQVVDQVRTGLRCAYCGMPFTDLDEPVEIAGKLYHSGDSCAGTIRRRLAAQGAP